jgi:hypothetical protein
LNLALETLMLPYLLVSCISMPQATLIYWATNSAFFMGLQNALARPRVASTLGLPAIMLPHPRHDKEARGAHCGEEWGGMLTHVPREAEWGGAEWGGMLMLV